MVFEFDQVVSGWSFTSISLCLELIVLLTQTLQLCDFGPFLFEIQTQEYEDSSFYFLKNNQIVDTPHTTLYNKQFDCNTNIVFGWSEIRKREIGERERL